MSLEPTFPKREYDQRYRRAREFMTNEGLDAILITDIRNYEYLSGRILGPLGSAMSRSRPCAMILPITAEPILIEQKPNEPLVRQTSWIKKFRGWAELPFRPKPIKEALEELGLAKGRIGTEMGAEDRMGISYDDLIYLKEELPEASFVNASEILTRLRIIKSKAEIDCIRKACDITSKMFQKLHSLLRRGMSETDVRKAIGALYVEEGTTGWGNPCIYPEGRHPGAPIRAHRHLEEGDTLFIDAGANCKGYQCDFARLFVVGNPSKWQKKMHTLVTDMTRECIELVKPGLRASEVARGCDAIYKRAGLVRTKMEIWGREGHGIGLSPWSFEPPSFSFTDNTIIAPGMVLTMEPDVSTTQLKPEMATKSTWLSDFRFCQEENFLVTKDGVEILSWASRELHVIS